MNTKNHFSKISLALSFLTLVLIGLTGCGPIDVGVLVADGAESDAGEVKALEVGIEPTPMPEKFTFTNDFYGFKFDYPETWTLAEIDHGVVLMKGTNRL